MSPGRFPGARRAAALLLLAALAAGSPAAAGRIVAVGDVHGDVAAFEGILRQAGLLDDGGRWSGGGATLVQVGDILDRGPSPRGAMDLLMRLQAESAAVGGRVIAMLGNHETANLLGDLRYVTPENFREYADDRSERRRRAAFRSHVAFERNRARRLGLPPPAFDAAAEAAWMEAHPPGFLEQREAFAPGGTYGRWLRQLPAVAQIGDTVFVHGGIGPALASRSAEEIDAAVKAELHGFDRHRAVLVDRKRVLPFATLEEVLGAARAEIAAGPAPADPELQEAARGLEGIGSSPALGREGPLWFRGYEEWSEEEGERAMGPVLAGLGAARVVVGHSPTSAGRIDVRFGGRVFLVDTGMLSSHYEGGRAAALEIDGRRIMAIYEDGRVDLEAAGPAPGSPQGRAPSPFEESAHRAAEGPAPRPAGAQARVWRGADGEALPFASDAEVMEFLRTARVVSMKDIGEGVTLPQKVLLEKDGVRANAVFRTIDKEQTVARLGPKHRDMFFRDAYVFECAAYELGRMLGLDNIPPVVERKIGSSSGSLQIWLEQATTETKRAKQGLMPPDIEAWQRQMQIVWMFDALIHNTDRNAGNLLIDRDWKVWMIDHTRAFRRVPDLIGPEKILRCDRALVDRIRALDPAETRRRLAPFLRAHEIDALLARRDKLLALVRDLIREKGEAEALFDWLEPRGSEPPAPAPAEGAAP